MPVRVQKDSTVDEVRGWSRAIRGGKRRLVEGIRKDRANIQQQAGALYRAQAEAVVLLV